MKQTLIFSLLTAGILAAAATCALAQTTDSGGLLRDKAGKTLYTFDRDAAGESNCFDACAGAWPPFMAAEGAKASGSLTLHARKDGGMQWGHNGKPLYFFAGDAKAGDANGDGLGGSWHAVKLGGGTNAAAHAAPVAGDPYKY